MMDAGMMQYDSRPVSAAPMHRPMVSTQYVMEATTYGVSPMDSTSSQAFTPPNPFGFSGYHSPTPTVSFEKPHDQYTGRPMQDDMHQHPEAVNAREQPYPTQVRTPPEHDRSLSPRFKPEPALAAILSAPNPSVAAKNIASNISLNPNNEVDFNTEVDTLMKAIQSKRETEELVRKAELEHQQRQQHQQQHSQLSPVVGFTPAPTPTPEPMNRSSLMTPPSRQAKSKSKSKPRSSRWVCEVTGCGRNFTQKTHLDIHRRAHTGDKPYSCNQPGCGQRFSQLGNLKTHQRRHTGERPFQCEECGKRFAQRGNVRAHRIVHLQAKPYVCKLEECHKTFTQLGNLKSHQNKFHAVALKNLAQKFAAMDPNKVSDDDRELWEYFATLYKNSNKGIKGRGKDRKVSCTPATSPRAYSDMRSATGGASMGGNMYSPAPQRILLPQHAPAHAVGNPSQSLNPPMSLAAYSVTRPSAPGPTMMAGPRDMHTGYGFPNDGPHPQEHGVEAAGFDHAHQRDLYFKTRLL